MPEIKNSFLKGRMNQDLDSRILPQGEYREAINLLLSRSEGSTVGEFENILGNTNVGTISSNKKAHVIGNCVDETNNRVYIFATDFSNTDENVRAPSTATCLIIEFDLSNPGSPTTLVSGHFLNFNQQFPIYGVNIIEELLFFTDNLNQPRRINITTARNAPATSQGPAYTEEPQLSVAKYYPYDVIIPMERSTATYSSGAGTTTLVVTQAQPNVKVGDILSDNNKGPSATELFVGPTNTQGVITVTKVNSTTNFTVSEALPNPIPAGFKIDFSRTSMKNVHDSLLPNNSIQKVRVIQSTTIVRIGQWNDQATYPVSFGGIPRVGDIVTNLTNPGATPAGLRITQVLINSTPASGGLSGTGFIWQLTFDQNHGISVDDNIQIAHNPDYEAGAPGDPKFLDDKFVRFSYRYKFNDNEYSLMAPFSQIMFIPKQFGQFNLGQVDGVTDLGTYGSDNTRDKNYYQDEKDSYTSTVVEWFENNVDTIDLKIPLPDTKDNLRQEFDVKEIDILYKESDALAVKVIDTLSVDDIQNTQVSTIEYDDPIHGIVGQNYLDYRYKSTKPYKTLPQNQTTRVYDKVPIKALAQETTSNRIVYGNIVERMTPPESIKYSVGFSGRKIISDYYTQYPYHSVKSNRTYQVGFVLADYYGRQSDVILSTYDNNTQLDGSSVFVNYKTESGNTSDGGVLGYIGENLQLTIDEEIASTANDSTGAPGLYKAVGHVASVLAITDDDSGYVAGKTYKTSGGSGTGCTVAVTTTGAGGEVTGVKIMTSGEGYTQGNTLTILGGGGASQFTVNVGESNPLGWYSYKVVVKQQEQEYYNVYLPGFVNGYPVQDQSGQVGSLVFNDTQRGKIAFSTLIGDNINKIPRNLREVGPTDREFNSDEIIYIRVNNPNVEITSNTGANQKQVPIPKNLQYYPGVSLQNVLNISTARDSELAAIPFVANAVKGIYGSQTQGGAFGSGNFPEPSGSLPWGNTSDKQSFYGAEENPFIMQFSTSSNPNNSVGAIVSGTSDTNYVAVPSASNPSIEAMQPVLSVAETAPVMSALDLYYETSLCGKLEVLNSSISVGSVAPSAVTNPTGTFTEGVALNAEIGNIFKFVDGNGTDITTNIASVSIEKVVRQSTPQVSETGLFTVAAPGSGGAGNYVIKTASNYFVFRQQSGANPSSDVYIFDLRVTSSLAATDPNYYNVVVTNAVTLTLQNVAPEIYRTNGNPPTNPLGTFLNFASVGIPQPAVGDTTVIQLFGSNGTNLSNTESNRIDQLAFSVTAVTPNNQLNDFSFSQSTLGLLNCQNLVDKQQYNVAIKLTDANAATGSLEKTSTLVFTAGAAFAPKVIKNGRIGGAAMGAAGNVAGSAAQFFFGNDTVLALAAAGSGLPAGYPQPSYLYNAQGAYNSPSTADYNGANNVAVAWLYQGSIQLEPKLAVASNGPYAGDATISVKIQYRTVNQNSYQGNNWVEIASSTNLPPGSYDTYDPSAAASAFILTGSTNQGSGTVIASKKYYFDQPGEYRVITTGLSGDGGNYAQFYVDFTDGDYPTGINNGPTNPTTP